MVKFNKELIMKKDTAIYCNTEEKFNLLLKWAEYEKIISESGNTQYKWSRYGKETYLDIYDDTFGNIEAYRRYDYNFLEYDDVLVNDEVKEIIMYEYNGCLFGQKENAEIYRKKRNLKEQLKSYMEKNYFLPGKIDEIIELIEKNPKLINNFTKICIDEKKY